MGRTSYTTLKERAEAAAGVAVAVEPHGVEVTDDEQRHVAAVVEDYHMRQLAKEADAIKMQHHERGEAHVTRVIDPHEGRLASVTSSWVPITPSMCTESALHGRGGACGWDAAKELGFSAGWDSIPEDLRYGDVLMRDYALEKLRQHKSIRHVTSGPAHIRTPEQARAARANRPLPETFIENPRL